MSDLLLLDGLSVQIPAISEQDRIDLALQREDDVWHPYDVVVTVRSLLFGNCLSSFRSQHGHPPRGRFCPVCHVVLNGGTCDCAYQRALLSAPPLPNWEGSRCLLQLCR